MFENLVAKWMIVDAFLLDRCFQRVSDWVRNQTGKSNFWIAKWFVTLQFALIVGSVMFIAKEAYYDSRRWPLVVSIIAMAYVSGPRTLFLMSTMLDKYGEELAEELENAQVANPLRLKFAGQRFASVAYSLLTWSLIGFALAVVPAGLSLAVAVQLMMTIITIVAYFLSCTPKPRKPQFQAKSVLA